MSHTCGFCGLHHKAILAPVVDPERDGDFEVLWNKGAVKTNHRAGHLNTPRYKILAQIERRRSRQLKEVYCG